MQPLSISTYVITLALAGRALAQVPNYCESRLVASNSSAGDRYGTSVAVHGNTVAVGAPNTNNTSGDLSGTVYVHTLTAAGWTEQLLNGSAVVTGGNFGYALALEGDTLAIGAPGGAPGNPGTVGAVYIFANVGGTWLEQQVLQASGGASALFGYSIGLAGDTLVACAPNGSAAVYAFERVAGTWSESATLIGSNVTSNSAFARAVAISGDTVIVGAPSNTSIFPGRAYVFTGSGATWSEQQILSISTPFFLEYFGNAVALDGDTALVSAPLFDVNRGIVYAFTRSGTTWSLQQSLQPSGVQQSDVFGYGGLGFKGDTAVISAPNHDANGTDSGTTYVFTRTGSSWSETTELLGNQTTAYDGAGRPAYDGTTIVIGVPNAGYSGVAQRGEAYVLRLTPGIDTYCTGKLNSMGCVPHMSACGTPSASSGAGFDITCFKVLDNTNGLMFYGYASNSAPFQDGTLCVQAPTRRTPVQLAQNVASSGACRSVFTIDFNAWIASGADPLLVPGANVFAQWWMRDPAADSTTGLSNGVSFSVGP